MKVSNKTPHWEPVQEHLKIVLLFYSFAKLLHLVHTKDFVAQNAVVYIIPEEDLIIRKRFPVPSENLAEAVGLVPALFLRLAERKMRIPVCFVGIIERPDLVDPILS